MSSLYHSDSLYSAVTLALGQFGMMEEWLSATVETSGAPAVRFTSCFPWRDDTLFVTPPKRHWPPQVSSPVRWKGASLVPVSMVTSLLNGVRPGEEDWLVDAMSRCLIRREEHPSTGPYRTSMRGQTPVDRLTGATGSPEQIACLEFARGAGLWFVVTFRGEEASQKWRSPVESAIRFLCDSGFGGKRSAGWGRSEAPQFTAGELPSLLLDVPLPASEQPMPEAEECMESAGETRTGHWLLSLFSPGEADEIQWGQGHYTVVARSGRIESPSGFGEIKRTLRMVTEGSVIVAGKEPRGAAPNVAPNGFPHPVYRYGFPVSIPIPLRTAQ